MHRGGYSMRAHTQGRQRSAGAIVDTQRRYDFRNSEPHGSREALQQSGLEFRVLIEKPDGGRAARERASYADVQRAAYSAVAAERDQDATGGQVVGAQVRTLAVIDDNDCGAVSRNMTAKPDQLRDV